jgi:hypothetical protein
LEQLSYSNQRFKLSSAFMISMPVLPRSPLERGSRLLSGPQWPRRQVPVLACKGPAGPQRAAVLFPTRCSVKSASRPLDARTEVPIAAASEPLVRARSPAAGRAARTLPPAVTNGGGDGVADAGDGDRVPIARSARPPTLTIGWSLTQGGCDAQAAAPGARRPSRTQVR